MVSQPFGERDRDGLFGEMVLVDVVEFMFSAASRAAFAEVFADNDRESDIVICHSDRFNLCGRGASSAKISGLMDQSPLVSFPNMASITLTAFSTSSFVAPFASWNIIFISGRVRSISRYSFSSCSSLVGLCETARAALL